MTARQTVLDAEIIAAFAKCAPVLDDSFFAATEEMKQRSEIVAAGVSAQMMSAASVPKLPSIAAQSFESIPKLLPPSVLKAMANAGAPGEAMRIAQASFSGLDRNWRKSWRDLRLLIALHKGRNPRLAAVLGSLDTRDLRTPDVDTLNRVLDQVMAGRGIPPDTAELLPEALAWLTALDAALDESADAPAIACARNRLKATRLAQPAQPSRTWRRCMADLPPPIRPSRAPTQANAPNALMGQRGAHSAAPISLTIQNRLGASPPT